MVILSSLIITSIELTNFYRLGSSSIFRRRKKSLNKRSNTSKIWNHFKRISATHCKCNYCPRAYVVSSGTGTLRTHLKTKHNSIFLKIQNSSVSDTPIHSNPNATNKPRRQVHNFIFLKCGK